MLNERGKKEMLADGLSCKRREEFSSAEKQKPRARPSLNDYMAFLMDVQKIKSFEHRRVITPSDKNIL
ncbi:MAG: hypothetical protein A3G91_00705 [Omnitrophica WOR_2 bacterium RIFCSPLOWO2_12_FULL_50_9]|nr:MAG: hypothetical protein A3D87_02120 [Omnitrophica WOR_2 bacterium RIFCSPHIGHO2_02_FULL_50_17]OGX40596.1 MAG: hypothetical protein A3G91_00705 [Omnitrophica WOR_2 bacterium RIFCSPLOWO2_12_FULL_50_9]